MRHHHYHSSNAFLSLVALDYLRRNRQQPRPQRAGPVTWLIVLALLALFAVVLAYVALDSLPWHDIGICVGIPLAVFGVGASLWVPTKRLWLAWWHGGWAADVIAAFFIVAIIGLIWPQTGILDGWVHSARQSTGIVAPVIPPAAIQLLKQHPETAVQFDAIFGAGSATREIGAPAIEAAPVGLNPQSPDAGYEALPSGTKLIGPDGLIRRKP